MLYLDYSCTKLKYNKICFHCILFWKWCRHGIAVKSTGAVNCGSPCCGHKLQIPAASRCPLGGPSATCAGSAGTSGSWWPRWQKCCPEIQQPAQTPRLSAPWCLEEERQKSCRQIFQFPVITVDFYSCETRVYSPMTQKGFRANFSLPLHPRYRQQQPADHIRTMYSTPKTTMVTISCIANHSGGVSHVARTHLHVELRCVSRNTHQDVQGTLRAVPELFNGGEDREDEAGKDQEEAKREEKKGNDLF